MQFADNQECEAGSIQSSCTPFEIFSEVGNVDLKLFLYMK